MSGLSSTGFDKKTVQEILTEINDEQHASLGPQVNTQADALMGVINGIMASKLGELWEVAEAVYGSQYPATASGIALDYVASITGAVRLPATKSTVTIVCLGTDGTVIPAGSIVSTDAGVRFVSTAEGTIADGYAEIPFEAEETGATVANTDTLTNIDTPISGWDEANNEADAVVGRELETDALLRVRRLQLLARQADATLEAIRSQVLAVDEVEQAFVFENATAATVGSMPAHSIEVVVSGGDDDDIRQAIFESKAAGIQAYGSTTGTVTDSQGFTHDIWFTRATEKPIEVHADFTTDDDFPDDGEDQVKTAIAAHINALVVGDDVIRTKLYDVIFNISGVVDVTSLMIGFVGLSYGTVNKTIGAREVATSDTDDIYLSIT